MFSNNSKYLIWLFAILVIKAFAIVGVILYSGIGLGPDEAQYWTWSKSLDWGYYSKPPAIAWQIWLGTQFFGDTEFGVRFMAIIINTLLALSVYALAKACKLSDRTAFWAGVIMALSPLGIIGAIIATTDGGMILFWTLACIFIADALAKREAPNYYLIGIAIALGALFKWPIYLLWVFILAFQPVYKFLYNKSLWIGVLISLLGLFPSVIWNWAHDWVTFRHVFGTVVGQHEDEQTSPFFKGNFFDFIGAQAALLSPVIFIILIFSFIILIKRRKSLPAPLVFCGMTTFSILLVACLVAIVKKMQGNWIAYAYPTGIVFLSWYACEYLKKGIKWIQIGVILSVFLSAFALSIPYLQSHNIISIPYKFNPFRHNVGWEKLDTVLLETGYDPKTDFLFGDKYQTSSIVSFYGPDQNRAYFLNLRGIRLNQFSFWPSLREEHLGKTGYFVLTENSPHLERNLDELTAFYEKELPLYFEKVEYLGVKTLFESNGKLGKGALIYKCIGYNGKEPPKPNRF